jgi:Tol biopolymer transport system component
MDARRIRVASLLAAIAALTVAAAPATRADDRAFGPWSFATALTPVNSPALDGCPFPTRDGRRLYIASTRGGPERGLDIWVSERRSPDDPWGPPENLGDQINTQYNEFCPSPGPDGSFMFVSYRPGGCGEGTSDIYITRFHPSSGWEPPKNLGCTINSPAEEAGPVRVGHELYFSSTRTGNSDIYESLVLGPWISRPAPVPELNTPSEDARPYVRLDGREIVFDSTRQGGPPDIWAATREQPWAPWSEPVNLGNAVNTPAFAETRPSLSADGTTLYFGSTRGTSQDVYTSTRSR